MIELIIAAESFVPLIVIRERIVDRTTLTEVAIKNKIKNFIEETSLSFSNSIITYCEKKSIV